MKKGNLLLAVVCALVVGGIAGIMFDRSQTVRFGSKSQMSDKLSHTLQVLQNQYVDSISRDSLAELVVPLLLDQLDPHSEYIRASDLTEVNEPLVGKFDGIGVTFNMATDTAQVISVIASGPSSNIGIMAGDRIMTIDDSLVAGRKLNQLKVVGMLRGERGTTVRLGIQRGENKVLLPFAIMRGVIPITSLEASYMTPDNQAYIRVSRFASTTYDEIMADLAKYMKQGAKGIILDLRGNGGGYYDQSIYLANEFLPRGALIVYIQGAHRERENQYASGSGRYQKTPLTILVDETTASSSEIFAGAMQDNDRAMVIGRRTFGKGLVQDQIQYSDGSAARITIARYYTPLGRALQKPYKAGDKLGYQGELYERFAHKEMLSVDSVRTDSTLIFMSNGGRKLYGGGGIMPDVFVPVDTTYATKYFIKLFHKNLIFKYAGRVTDARREQVNAVRNFEDLDRLFASMPNIYVEFLAYASREGVAPTQKEIQENRNLITSQLKAYIGRNTPLQESAFYWAVAPYDNVMQQIPKIK